MIPCKSRAWLLMLFIHFPLVQASTYSFLTKQVSTRSQVFAFLHDRLDFNMELSWTIISLVWDFLI